jgi:polyisoprenoid-binding protein YceI
MASSVWTIDSDHSTAEFSVRHMMITTVKGVFRGISGQLRGDPEHLGDGQVTLEIDVTTVDTHQADRDNHLRTSDFFDAEHYPRISFVSQRIVPTGGNRYQVTGALTIRGVTKEEVVDVTYEGQGNDPWGGTRAGFSATATINRKDYGVNWNAALEAGGVLVGDQVKIAVELELVHQA